MAYAANASTTSGTRRRQAMVAKHRRPSKGKPLIFCQRWETRFVDGWSPPSLSPAIARASSVPAPDLLDLGVEVGDVEVLGCASGRLRDEMSGLM
jgi:hypothetical protein